ncbi:MAG: response regulator transcription factor [Gammaproteobacteria bacterium]|nr:response regulator transcription factor [Gammaproteobacteria bacterium]
MDRESEIRYEQIIYIIDDDESVRNLIHDLMLSVGMSARKFSSAAEFISCLDHEIRGCLIADIQMAGMTGLQLQDHLIKLGVSIPIIFVTGHGDISTAVRAIKAGASGFLEKPFDNNTLLEMVNTALMENIHHLKKIESTIEIKKFYQDLTKREQDVLNLILNGKSSKKIAKDLAISHRTVEVHRYRIFRKLNVNTITQLLHIFK